MGERYYIRTFGCQMNQHDSVRIAGLLEAQGMEPASGVDDADLVVLNTCAVRENADNKLYGTLGHLATTKARRRLTIAVGGCLAQKDQGGVLERAPWVDVVFGTHNIGSLPALLRRARERGVAQAEFFDEMQAFPSALPVQRDADWSAWVAISVGCNNTCTFCIVPKLRGKERSRRVGDVVAEAPALHQPEPQGLPRGRGRGHGELPAALRARALPAAVRLGPRAAADAPRLPPAPLHGDPRQAARHHPWSRLLDRHHRRLPGGDRGGLRADPGGGRGGPLRFGLHFPVLAAPGHRGGGDARSGPAPGRP